MDKQRLIFEIGLSIGNYHKIKKRMPSHLLMNTIHFKTILEIIKQEAFEYIQFKNECYYIDDIKLCFCRFQPLNTILSLDSIN